MDPTVERTTPDDEADQQKQPPLAPAAAPPCGRFVLFIVLFFICGGTHVGVEAHLASVAGTEGLLDGLVHARHDTLEEQVNGFAHVQARRGARFHVAKAAEKGGGERASHTRVRTVKTTSHWLHGWAIKARQLSARPKVVSIMSLSG